MTEFIVADSGIRQLHARFTDAVWRKDADAFADCFAHNGEWKIASMHILSRAEIGSTFAKLMGACDRVQLILGMPILEVEPGAADDLWGIAYRVPDADAARERLAGEGFDVSEVPEDRKGIARSITARVKKAGGTVDIISDPGEGTEVVLRMPVETE